MTYSTHKIPRVFLFLALTAVVFAVNLVVGGVETQAQQRSEVDLIIGGRIGAQPRFAVPDCLALTGDEVTAQAASTIAEV